MGIITYIYVKLFYFFFWLMLYSTLALYIFWGTNIEGTVIRSVPPVLAVITAIIQSNPRRR